MNHHNAVRTLIACKSSMKQTDDEFLKPTHLLMVGPRSLGKSFMVKKVLNLLAPGQWDPCSHVSDQAYYGQMPCSDTMTANKTFFYDEGDGPKLGARNRKTLAKAENSKEKKSTEYKERLTTKWSLSTVLGKDRDDQRQVQQFEVSNENVQIHCMNSYFDLAPAMLSRFNLMFFHNIKRLDRELGTARARARARFPKTRGGPTRVLGNPRPIAGAAEQADGAAGAAEPDAASHDAVPRLPPDAAGDAAVRGRDRQAVLRGLEFLQDALRAGDGQALRRPRDQRL